MRTGFAIFRNSFAAGEGNFRFVGWLGLTLLWLVGFESQLDFRRIASDVVVLRQRAVSRRANVEQVLARPKLGEAKESTRICPCGAARRALHFSSRVRPGERQLGTAHRITAIIQNPASQYPVAPVEYQHHLRLSSVGQEHSPHGEARQGAGVKAQRARRCLAFSFSLIK